ncbi:MAG: NAD-dependent epimerase/dehydratase family protein [Longimicrobiales bacterium]
MKSGNTVFLTGGTGFIGSRLARVLRARGDRVRCLVRDPSRAGGLARLGAELIAGDITDRAALARGLAGADAAIHLAAIYDVGVVNESAMERVNVAGTKAFLESTAKAGTSRCIHVSTTVALGPVSVGTGDESTRNHGPYRSAYERTKVDAHERALAAQQSGLPLIIVCPSYVYGAGDTGPGGRFLRDLVRGRVPGLLARPAWFSFVHVDDVVSGIVSALDRGETGESYVLSGEEATINVFAARAAAAAGVRVPFLRFPAPLARMTGRVLDMMTRATGARFPITRENVDTVAGHRWLHSHAKATEELSWVPRSLAEGLPTTMTWAKTGAAT